MNTSWNTKRLREATKGVQDRVPCPDGMHGCGLGLHPDTNQPAVFVWFDPGTIPTSYPTEIDGVPIIAKECKRPGR